MTNTAGAEPAALKERLSEKELCPDDLLKGQEEAFQRDIERLQARYSEFVRVPCPACYSDSYTESFEKHTFHYVTCSGCGTLYMNPRPSPEVMGSYYANSENYKYWAKYIFPASEGARRNKIHKPWLERVIGYCDRYSIPRGVLMEVGAGFGTFSWLAHESGMFKEVVAVEPTPEMAESCRARGVHVINKRIEEIGDEIESADVAVAFEVIEHLFEPQQFLEQCAQRIKPGGLLVLSCPNGQGFDIAMLGRDSLAVDPEHVNLFNPASLSLLVEACGFEVLEVSTPGRLDAEFVHTAIEEGTFDVSGDPFLKRVLVDEWERLGWPFQQFLAENGLSAHMWLAARKR
jgi:2-polyprenyl-3-methyl-5-hydroxy-6-metoxy-1,4-benzoquinol methylase/ribosomal protein S27E